MVICTLFTRFLPESINNRKPTLKEYVESERMKLEGQSIELAQIKSDTINADKEGEDNAYTSTIKVKPITPQEVSQEAPQEVPQETPQEVPQEAPQETAITITENSTA